MKTCLYFIGGLLLLASVADAGRDIVVFGDSLSDSGQGYAANAKLVLQTTETYPQRPYYAGRWQNGPSWIEHGAKLLSSALFNYAAGGATAGSEPAQVPPLPVGFAGLTIPTTVLSPNLFQQINSHLLYTNGTLSSKPVYMVFLGINSYFSILFANTSATFVPVIEEIERGMDILYRRGARDFIVPILPEISALPAFNGKNDNLYGTFPQSGVDAINRNADAQNVFHKLLPTTFPATHPGATVYNYDWNAALLEVVTNASRYNITNLVNACYVIPTPANQLPRPTYTLIGRAGGTECPNVGNYLFWDQFHLTAKVHQAIGENFARVAGPALFKEKPVFGPGPSKAIPPSISTIIRGELPSARSPGALPKASGAPTVLAKPPATGQTTRPAGAYAPRG